MRIDYSISLWNYTHYALAPSLERVLTLTREQGYGIELWGAWRDETDLYSEVGRKRLKSALQGMHVSLHTAGASTFDLHQKQIDAAADLGAQVVVLHANDLYVNDAQNLDIRLACQVIAYANERGVKLALENGTQKGQLHFITQALEQVDGLYACLDVGHVYLSSESFRQYLDVMKSRLIHLHIQDLATEAEVNLRLLDPNADHYIPGTGSIPEQDWKLLIATLAEIDFHGDAVFEIRPRNPLQSALLGKMFLQRLGL